MRVIRIRHPVTEPPTLRQLEESGFAIVPDVLPPATVDNLIHAIEILLGNRTDSSEYALRNLHQKVPAVRRLEKDVIVRALVNSVLGPDAFVVRSIFFDKTPDANWKVAWHQDLTIAVREEIEVPGFAAWSIKDGLVHVQPPVSVLERMVTLRLHLDDCGLENGPLQVIPKSHNAGRLTGQQISACREREKSIACVVPRGGALLMRPLLLHASSPATTPLHRRVVHLNFASDPLPGGLEWEAHV
jgi:ectoine hydroxylase-related dioxygenase (phytanoyl-CoA dioxygenase family)